MRRQLGKWKKSKIETEKIQSLEKGRFFAFEVIYLMMADQKEIVISLERTIFADDDIYVSFRFEMRRENYSFDVSNESIKKNKKDFPLLNFF